MFSMAQPVRYHAGRIIQPQGSTIQCTGGHTLFVSASNQYTIRNNNTGAEVGFTLSGSPAGPASFSADWRARHAGDDYQSDGSAKLIIFWEGISGGGQHMHQSYWYCDSAGAWTGNEYWTAGGSRTAASMHIARTGLKLNVRTDDGYQAYPAQAAISDPTDIANLLAWYDASSGVYTDAGTTPATDGQTVQQWNDLSGNGYHASQATSANRPTYDTTGLNSNDAVVFDYNGGTNPDFMKTVDTVPVNTATVTVFAVGYINSGSQTYARITGFTENGQTNDYATDGGCCWLLQFATNEVLRAYRNNGGIADVGFDGGRPINFDEPFIGTSLWTGTHGIIGVNGHLRTWEAFTAAHAATGTINLGCNSSTDGLLKGAISEVIIYTRSLNIGEINAIHDYLSAKWSIPLRHPV